MSERVNECMSEQMMNDCWEGECSFVLLQLETQTDAQSA